MSKPGPESVCVCVLGVGVCGCGRVCWVWACVGVGVCVGVWGCVRERVIKRVPSLNTCVSPSREHVSKPEPEPVCGGVGVCA